MSFSRAAFLFLFIFINFSHHHVQSHAITDNSQMDMGSSYSPASQLQQYQPAQIAQQTPSDNMMQQSQQSQQPQPQQQQQPQQHRQQQQQQQPPPPLNQLMIGPQLQQQPTAQTQMPGQVPTQTQSPQQLQQPSQPQQTHQPQTQQPAQQVQQQLQQPLQQQQQQQVQQIQQQAQQQPQHQSQQQQSQQQQQPQQHVQQQQQLQQQPQQQIQQQPQQQLQQQPTQQQQQQPQSQQQQPQHQPQLHPQPQPQPHPQPPQQQQQQPQPIPLPHQQVPPHQDLGTPGFKYQSSVLSPLYLGHNPFIEILRPFSYADDNIVTLNLSHSHIYEIDSEAFVGQRFEHIDLSNNKLGLIHSRSFRIGPNHSRHTPYDPRANSSSILMKQQHPHQQHFTRRPPPAHPKSVTIDFSHNPAIVALSGAFDQIDVPNCLLNFTNSTVELKFGAFKKYFKEHPGHLIDIDTVDCCDQEWLLGYKHNFVARTHCAHDPNLYLLKVSQQTIIDSCIAYVTSARHSMTMPSSGIIHSAAANAPRHSSGGHSDNQQYLTYLILGGTAMILTSLSIYIIFYMFTLKAAFVYQMQTQKN